MILCDVNVWISAFRADSPHHAASRQYVEELVNSDVPFAWTSFVFSALVRVTTNRKIFREANTVAEAIAFCQAIQSSPNAIQIEAGNSFWTHFERALEESGATGADVTDAHLAALAMEHGCTFVTWDRGFCRFQGLKLSKS
jgi:toxin-antitoxin system PIN domain toxin